ncbi:TPA: LPXTG cell wall anchor domain-containing protein, partial [Enterococcus faecium]|nr:LPXTG cell wall anchor domain-containing protein [Enterococcus faecium]
STSSTESSEAMGIIGSSRDKLKTTKNRIENKNLPKTGEQRNLFLSSVGGILVIMSLIIFIMKKYKKER